MNSNSHKKNSSLERPKNIYFQRPKSFETKAYAVKQRNEKNLRKSSSQNGLSTDKSRAIKTIGVRRILKRYMLRGGKYSHIVKKTLKKVFFLMTPSRKFKKKK